MNHIGKRIVRFQVPSNFKCWSVDFPDYKPVDFSLDFTDKPWADPNIGDCGFNPKWNEIDGKINRKSHSGVYQVVDGYPLNPTGRTGIRLRGKLGKWGPNHAGDAVVTRWKRDANNAIINDEGSKRPILQFVSIRRRDNNEWAIPGGMVDVGETVAATVRREFCEEALNSLKLSDDEKKSLEQKLNAFFESGREIHRGIVDDPRNTDNAWMETVVYNFHDDSGDVLKDVHFTAGDDAVGVKWFDISSKLQLYANHISFIAKVAEKLNAYF